MSAYKRALQSVEPVLLARLGLDDRAGAFARLRDRQGDFLAGGRIANAEIGASLGLHATDFLISLDGQGTVNGVTTQIEARRKKVLAPLPTLGLYGSFEVAPRFVLGGNVDWLKLKVGDYDGRLLNFEAKASYRVMKNVALGVMYRSVDYRVDVEKPEWVGSLRYKFHGPAVFLHAGF